MLVTALRRRSVRPRAASYLTVRELLQLPLLSGARVMTPPLFGMDRIVRSASVQEVPLEDFVRPDELVLTTGVGLGSDAALADFVEHVAGSGAAALAIAVPHHIRSAGERAVATAVARGLPLVQIPWAVRFGDVVEYVLRTTLDGQSELLRQSEEIYRSLTHSLLEHPDMSHMCETLATVAGRQVKIFDRWGDAIAQSRAGKVPEATATPVRVPISAAGRDLGRLEFGWAPEEISDFEAQLIKHAATTAGLMMLIVDAAVEGEARGRSDIVSALLHGWAISEQELELRARAINLDPRKPHIVVVLRAAQSTATPSVEPQALRWAIDRASAGRQLKVFQAITTTEPAFLLEPASGAVLRGVTELLDDIVRLLRLQAPGARITGGIGREVSDLRGLPESLREARAALRVGHLMRGEGSATRYSDLGAYSLLFDLFGETGTQAALEDFLRRTLAPIAAHETKSRMPLQDTLIALFEENGNVSATARRLGINRQSLLYRLAKVEEVSALNLASARDRFALELAVRTRQAGRLLQDAEA